MNNEIEQLNKLTNQIEHELKQSLSEIESLNNPNYISFIGNDAQIQSQAFQLILQYRLDFQDALVMLMRIEKSILQYLGIEGLAPSKANLDRLAYTLGNEDLQLALTALSRLIDKLLKAIYQYERSHMSYQKHKEQLRQQKQRQKVIDKFKKIRKTQQKLISGFRKFKQNTELLVHREAIGSVVNHIAALEGPISRFYQLILSGLKQSHQLYEKMDLRLENHFELKQLIQQTDKFIQQMAYQNQKSTLFQPKLSISQASDHLELRATKRRLGHFFHH